MRSSKDRILVSHAGNLPRPDVPRQPDRRRQAHRGRQAARSTTSCLPKGVQRSSTGRSSSAWTSSTTASTSRPAATAATSRSASPAGRCEPVDPSKPPKRAGTAERDRRDFPGFYASGLWFSGSGGPIRPGFMTPGEVRNTNPRETRVCTGPIKYTAQAEIKKDMRQPQGRARGQGRRGLHRRARAAEPGRRRPQRVLPQRRGVHDGRRGGRAARSTRRSPTPASSSRSTSRSSAPPGCSIPDWTRRGVPQVPRVLRRGHQPRARGLPEDQIRFHTCWGSGHRPHVNDIELKYIADMHAEDQRARSTRSRRPTCATSTSGRSGRTSSCRTGKILMPGVISHATDLVEHPELIAERLRQLRQRGRQGERADRHGLRHRLARRPRGGRLGQAKRHVRRRRDRLEEALGQVSA